VAEALTRLQRAFYPPEPAKPNVSECQAILSQIKVMLVEFQLIPPFSLPEAEVRRQLLLARETLEIAAFLSIEAKDEVGFERHLNQVKIYYHDYGFRPPSERKWTLLGVWLLHLLSQNRMGEFHTELELIAQADQQNLYIAFPVQLEKRLMEGTYNKVVSSDQELPHPSYSFFMAKLTNSARTKILECSERAYKQVNLDQVSAMLMVPSTKDAMPFISAAKGTTVSGNQVTFTQNTKASGETPSMRLIRDSLLYATELERII